MLELGKKFSRKNLAQAPELFSETIALIEREFKYSADYKFEIDFYPLMRKENHQHCHLLIDNETNKVVGHIGFLQKNLKFKNLTLPTQFIGGICIDKKYQGQRLFTHFFKTLTQEYISNIALHVLWGDLHEVYKKFDFYPAGIQYSVAPSGDGSLKEIKFKSQAHLYNKIHETHLAPTREEADWDILKNITSSKLYADDKNYFFANKGFDLTHIAHEYYFTDKKIKIPFQLWSRGEVGASEHVALIKIVNVKYFYDFYSEFPAIQNLSTHDFILNCIDSIEVPATSIIPTDKKLKLYISGLDSI